MSMCAMLHIKWAAHFLPFRREKFIMRTNFSYELFLISDASSSSLSDWIAGTSVCVCLCVCVYVCVCVCVF